MLLEIQEGESVTIETSVVSVVDVRFFSFANCQGVIENRRAAVVEIAGRRIEIEEGSMIQMGVGSPMTVVGIRRQDKIGLVRLSSRERQGRLFKYAREGFENEGRPFEPGMSLLLSGVTGVNQVLACLDDHADALPSLLTRLEEAASQLEYARHFLPPDDCPKPVVAYVDCYLSMCRFLLVEFSPSVYKSSGGRFEVSASSEIMLSYCDICGQRVLPYLPSTAGLEPDPWHESRVGWMYYDCSRCGETHPALCPEDTGLSCPRCREINRMVARHCASCGESMHD